MSTHRTRLVLSDVYDDGSVRVEVEGDRSGGLVLRAGESLEITWKDPVEVLRERDHLVFKPDAEIIEQRGLTFCDRCDGWGDHRTDQHEEPAGNGAAWVALFALLLVIASYGAFRVFVWYVAVTQ